MIIDLIFLFIFIYKTQQQCVNYKINTNECYSCGSGFYTESEDFKDFLGRITLSSCKQITNTNEFVSKVYISATNKCTTGCDGSLAKPYQTIVEAFSKEWTKAMPYPSANLEFILLEGNHYILQSHLNGNKAKQFFRGLNATISLRPCIVSEDTKCSAPAKIIMKTDLLYFYTAYKLEISDIDFEFQDIWSTDATCRTKTEQCCSNDKMNSTDAACSLFKKTVAFQKSREESNAGLFNFEPVLENPQIPTLTLKNVNIRNLYSIENQFGYTSLFQYRDFSFKLIINRLTVESFLLEQGIVHMRSSKDKFLLYFDDKKYNEEMAKTNQDIDSTLLTVAFHNKYLISTSISNIFKFTDHIDRISFKDSKIVNCVHKENPFFNFAYSSKDPIKLKSKNIIFDKLNATNNEFINMFSFTSVETSISASSILNDISISGNTYNNLIVMEYFNLQIRNSIIENEKFNEAILEYKHCHVLLYKTHFKNLHKTSANNNTGIIYIISKYPETAQKIVENSEKATANVTNDILQLHSSTFELITTQIVKLPHTMLYLEIIGSIFLDIKINANIFDVLASENKFIMKDSKFKNVSAVKNKIFYVWWNQGSLIHNSLFYKVECQYILHSESTHMPKYWLNVTDTVVSFSKIDTVITSEGYYLGNGFNNFMQNVLLRNNIPAKVSAKAYAFSIGGQDITLNSIVLRDNDDFALIHVFRYVDIYVAKFMNIFVKASVNLKQGLFDLSAPQTRELGIDKFVVETSSKISFERLLNLKKCTKLEIKNSIFRDIHSTEGVLISFESSNLTSYLIKDNLFINIQGEKQTSVFVIKTDAPDILKYESHETIPSLNSKNQFGIINAYFLKSDYSFFVQVMKDSQLYVKNATFINGIGGVIDMQSNGRVVIENSNIRGTVNKQNNGGVFHLASLSKIAIFSTEIIDSKSTERGGVIFAQNSFIGIKDSVIKKAQSSSGGIVYSEKSEIKLKNCSFEDSKVNTRGGFFLVKEGSFEAIDSKFISGISGVEASGVYTFLANVTMGNVLFEKCISQKGDGTLYLIENPDIENRITGLTCKSNSAFNGACILAYNIQLKIDVFNVLDCTSTEKTIIEIFSVKGKMKISITKFNYSANTATEGISFRDLLLEIDIFTIEKNKVSSVSPIKINDCNFKFKNMTFSDNNIKASNQIVNVMQISNSESKIINSIFSLASSFTFISCSRCLASELESVEVNGGLVEKNKALLEVSSSDFKFISTVFKKNSGEDNSQMLKFSASKVFLSNVIFTQNNFSKTSALFESRANSFNEQITLTIEGLTSSDNNASLILSTENLLKQKLSGLKFVGDSEFQSAADLVNSQEIIFQSSSFKNFGGKSTIDVTNTNTDFVTFATSNSGFENCKGSTSGGCISLIGNINGTISNSNFLNGSSTKEGGCIFYDCKSKVCNMTIESSTWFRDCKAEQSGWAVKSADQTVNTNGKTLNITMSSTPTGVYTPMAGKASKAYLVIGENNRIKLLDIAQGKLKDNTTKFGVDLNGNGSSNIVINATSGEKLILAFFYHDDYDNHMSFDTTTLLKIDSLDNEKNVIVFENNVIQNNQNIFLFENFTIVVIPGKSYSVRVILKTSQEETFFNIAFNLRICIKGEIYLNQKCLKCETNYYSLNKDPMKNNVTKCKECPKERAECLGGDQILPKDNYWRMHLDSEYFIPCPLENCNSPVDDYKAGKTKNIMAVCESGYQGNLCIDCSKGHGKFDTTRCMECSSFLSQFGKAFIVVGFTLILVYQIYSTFNEEEISQKQTAFIKIMVNHLTYMALLSKFKLGIPTDFLSFLTQIKDYMPTSPEAAMSFDCLIKKDGNSMKAFIIFKLILILFLPFIYSFVCTFVKLFVDWVIPKLIKNKRLASQIVNTKVRSFRIRWIITYTSSVIVLFYNLYPHLLTVITYLMGCVQLEGTSSTHQTGPSYLEFFPSIQCWTEEHRDLVLIIALPDLIIWCIGTPILFLVISKMAHKKELNSSESGGELETLIFKYFVSDYKSNYYYWESFSFLRKFSIIVLAFLMRDLEPISQGGLLVFAFFVFLYVHENCHPYKEDLPNYFEAFSYIICIATTSLIILISSGSSQFTAETQFDIKTILLMILMGLFNFVFYGSWGFIMIKLYWSDYKGILNKIKAVTLKKRSFANPFSNPRKSKNTKEKGTNNSVVPKNSKVKESLK